MINILIADDEESVCSALSDLLQDDEHYHCDVATNGQEATRLLESNHYQILITDLKMPVMDGDRLIASVRERDKDISIIIITAFYSEDNAIQNINQFQISGYIKKPFKLNEVANQVEKVAINIELQRQEQSYRRKLEKQLQYQKKELERKSNAYVLELIQSLNNTLESKDRYTYGHSIRVSRFSRLLLLDAKIEIEDPKNFFYAAMLHDIGKIGISDSILNKPDKLTDAEFDVIKSHPVEATKILRNISNIEYIKKVIRHHHERFDGKGYPDKLIGEAIPVESRIISIVDTFDALISDRPYRKGKTFEEAVQIIKANLRTQFDPKLGEIFIEVTVKNFSFINSILKDFDHRVFINY